MSRSQTTAERRRADRERKRAQRAQHAAMGRPSADQCYHAVTEALAFAIATADKRAFADGWTPVNSALIFAVALDILSVRGPFDREQSKRMLISVLGPRSEHAGYGYVPSKSPAPGMPRYKLRAPESVTGRQ